MLLLGEVLYLLLAISHTSNASKGFRFKTQEVTTEIISSMIPGDPLFVHTATSAIQCVHLCVRNAACYVAVFQEDQNLKNLCHLLHTLKEEDADSDGEDAISMTMAYTLQAPRSCKEVYERHGVRESGIFHLRDIGDHYCKMDPGYCGKGGWTLAVKVDGNKETFKYTSPYWSNTVTYNVEKCLENISSKEEGKFQAFIDLPFAKICFDMKEGAHYKGVELEVKGYSLRKLFEKGQFIPTYAGRNAWKSLVSDSSLQSNCNKEGMNIQTPFLKARLGIVANDETNCDTIDSILGVGLLSLKPVCFGFSVKIASGNFAKCFSDNGDKEISTVSRIFLR